MNSGFSRNTDDNALMTIAAEICNIMEARTGQQYPTAETRNRTTEWNEDTQSLRSEPNIINPGAQANRTYIQPTRPISIPGGDTPQPPLYT